MISIVTITHNRRNFLPFAIDNFNRNSDFDVEWVILDDSIESNIDLIPKKKNINYIFLDQEKISFFLNQAYSKIEKKTSSWNLWYKYHLKTKTLPIGMKRNIANTFTKGNIIVHYDDDDYYSQDSLKYRINSLENFDCVYCSEITCFNTFNQKYFLKGDENCISEATMAYYKHVWKINKFNNYDIEEEGNHFISNIKSKIINSDNIIISLFHSNNSSITLNQEYIEPKQKLNNDIITQINNIKSESNCNQNQDLWILRDLYFYQNGLNYISIFPEEDYHILLDKYKWNGSYFGNNKNNNNFISNDLKNFKNHNFPKHINFLNI